jgi:hypothetical protein
MWLYENKEINIKEDFPEENIYGFVYKITNKTTGKFYIGKKQILSQTRKKIGKEQKAKNKLLNIWKEYEVVIKEMDWQNYWGSSKELQADVKTLGKENFDKQILRFCKNTTELTYWETAYQFKEDVLLRDSYNDTILGRFYRKTLVK